MPASAPPHLLQKRKVVQWDKGAVLGADGGTGEVNVSAVGIKPLSHRCRPPRLLWVSPVDAGQKVTELRRRDRHHAVGRARP